MQKLTYFLRPYKWAVLSMIVLMFIQTFGQLLQPHFTADIINYGVLEGDTTFIWRTGGIMLLVVIFTAASSIGALYFSSRLGATLSRDFRKAIYNKATNLSLSEFNEIGSGSMITRNTNDIVQVSSIFVFGIQFLLPGPTMAIGALILALMRDRVLTLILLGVVVVALSVGYVVCFKALPHFMALQPKMDNINKTMREIITGVRVIRAFNQQGREHDRITNVAADYAQLSVKINKIFAVFMPAIFLAMNIGTIFILWFGGVRVIDGSTQIGNIMAVIEYSVHIMLAIMMMSWVVLSIPRAQVSANRINEILDVENIIMDGTKPVPAIESLSFKNVDFAYQDADESVLSDISFEVSRGQTLAIMGTTGSGKSTLVNLIPRFYENTKGSIEINGIDIKDFPVKELRKTIGFVTQKPIMFSGSVKDNIDFGNSATDAKIAEAMDTAQATAFVEEKEGGLEEKVSQGGTNFSGGQKQRLSIARALARNAKLYIFDDSFSALDYKTDRDLRVSLREKVKDSIFIIVAQRISTIKNADQIIVLNDGQIAAKGTHKELLKTSQIYQDIVYSQLDEAEALA